jgi:hypothetical protein
MENKIVGHYKIDIDKIKTIKDIKVILKHMNLTYAPTSKEDYEDMKHLLILN